MYSKTPSNITRLAFGAAVLLCAAGLATAQTSNTVISFSVDMTGSPNFVLGSDQVAVRGTFNGYGTYYLTNNPTAANPYLFGGTLTDTVDTNGGQVQYKFWDSDPSAANGGWESPVNVNGGNRIALLPVQSGASLVIPTAFYDDDGPSTNSTVTFQVDMAQQINLGTFNTNSDTVEVQGIFEGWSSGDTLTNDPTILRTNIVGAITLVTSNVYVGTYTATVGGSPGQTEEYKFVIQPTGNYESPAAQSVNSTGNRIFEMANQTLPIVNFSDQPYSPIVTNAVTFQVDMTAQILSGAYTPGGELSVNGAFNNWTAGVNVCTNNPNAANTNVYSCVIVFEGGVGIPEQYKFVNGSTYESLPPAAPNIGGNRFFYLPDATTTTLPVVYFSDIAPNVLVGSNTLVTFTVNMTAAVEVNSPQYAFDPATDSVYLNGDFLGWPSWNVPTLGAYQMTNNPIGSSNYSITVPIPAGNSLLLTYKYGMYNAANSASYNNLDDEAGFAQNHARYVRTLGSYTLPVDTFGNQYDEPLLFGQLSIGNVSGGTVPISWLGVPGVHLQTSTNLQTGVWVDHPETDGASWTSGYISDNGFISVTNYSAGSSALFFRLVQPPGL